MYICVCKGIGMSEAVEVAKKTTMSPEAVVDSFHLGEGDSCGRCANFKYEIARLLTIELNKPRGGPAGAENPLPYGMARPSGIRHQRPRLGYSSP